MSIIELYVNFVVQIISSTVDFIIVDFPRIREFLCLLVSIFFIFEHVSVFWSFELFLICITIVGVGG